MKRLILFVLSSSILIFFWCFLYAGESFQDLSNSIQYQSANTQEGLQNYQRCLDISRDWWKLHQPELALDFLYESAREAEQLVPAKLSASKLLELAEIATQEYRDRYTAEDMIAKSRTRIKLILDYYEWRVPYREANRIEKEAELLTYLPRGKYLPRQVILPTPGTGKTSTPDDLSNNNLNFNIINQLSAKIDRDPGPKPDPGSAKVKPPLPEPKRPKEPPSKPDKPPVPPDKPPQPPEPPKPPKPPDKPPKPPVPPDKPPRPPLTTDTTK